MKIQFILNYSDLYGANRSILSVIEHLHRNGYELNVLIPSKGRMYSRLKEIGVPCEVVPYYAAFLYIKPVLKHVLIPLLALINVLMFPIVVFKINRFNPDIIYSNTSAENIGIFVAKLLKVKHILHVREFMKEDYNASFVLGRKLKSKFIDLSTASIYVSKSVLNAIHEDRVNHARHKVIYNGITAKKHELPIKNTNFSGLVFGIVGIFDAAKGQHKAIKYFNSLLATNQGVKLLIYGDKEGPYKEQLIQLVNDLKLNDKVVFMGFETDMRKIYNSIDVLLMFSRSEGFGRVTVEAAFMGVPVIGFDNAGTSEIIEDEKTGYLFTDEKSFQESVFKILESPTNYEIIRKNAFLNARKKFSEDVYCKKVEEFVLQVNTNFL